ncbi:PCC domain-containing protein [Herbaspirillum sp. NPDC087042]|uniref:PCC domain-containing protein n=1 Tax=Herbaspirillum sp. NPDC087042 TaxID=3364004 RepID=UPI0038125DD5
MPAPQAFARTVRHPGQPEPERIVTLEGQAMQLDFTLEAGLSLRDAMSIPLSRAGLDGGTVRFANLPIAELHFLMPALAVDDQHAAFYSAPQAMEEGTLIEYACATYGRKDGEPFVHCHAVWRGRDGQRQGGHLMMDKTIVGAATPAQAWGLHDATMATRYDPETNFTLFYPTRLSDAAPAASGKRVVLARIRPDQDLTIAVEQACAAHGIVHAIVRGSVGSIIGAEFEDGRVLDDRATEILILSGEVRQGRGRLEIGLINPQGQVCEGVLARGGNPVLICFELVLEEQ